MTTITPVTRPSASAVSAALRKAGLRPLPSGTPRSREGLRVSRSLTQVCVSADLDLPGAASRMARDAAEILTDAGYAITDVKDASFYVTGRQE